MASVDLLLNRHGRFGNSWGPQAIYRIQWEGKHKAPWGTQDPVGGKPQGPLEYKSTMIY